MTQASLVVQVAALGTWVLRVSLGKHLGALALRKSWVDGVCTCATHKFIAPPRIHTTPGTETTNSRPWVMRVSRPPVDFRVGRGVVRRTTFGRHLARGAC